MNQLLDRYCRVLDGTGDGGRHRDGRALIAQLRSEGCEVDEKIEESEFGKFGWVMDPEGNRLELCQPPERQ